MKQLFVTGLLALTTFPLWAQIKTSELEVRIPTGSTVNEIAGETEVSGALKVRSSTVGGTIGGSFDNLILEQSGANVGFTFKSLSTHQAGIAFGDESDHNMGRIIYHHNGDYMGFWTKDVERLRMLANGNIGIGTITPTGLLHISTSSVGGSINDNYNKLVIEGAGNIGLTLKSPNTNNTGIAFADSDDNNSGRIIYRHTDNRMSFYVNDEEKLSIINNNIGIGNTNPQSRLMVSTGNFQLGGKQGILIGGGAVGNGNYTPAVGFSNSAASMDAAISGVQEGSDNNAMGLAFFVHSSGTSSDPKQEAMRITKNGFVGIGTSTPSGKLEVAHTGKAELVISGGGSSYSNAGLVLKATNGTGARATGVYMHDAGQGNEWYAGRPYQGSDKYVIYRNPNASSHTNASSTIASAAGVPTGAVAFFGIKADGNVGIGTNAPTAKLTVDEPFSRLTMGAIDGEFRIRSTRLNNYTYSDLVLSAQENVILMPDGGQSAYSGQGNVGIGTNNPSQKLHVNGNVLANNVSVSSDRRWKKNINEIVEASATLNNINPVSYELRKDEFPEKDFDESVHYGVIAQELEKVLPELVSTDLEGFKSVDYQGMIGLLIKGFQERGEEIQRLKAELANERATDHEAMASLEKRLSKLEALLMQTVDQPSLEAATEKE